MTPILIKNLSRIRPIWRLLILFSLGFLIFITLANTVPSLYYTYFDTTPYYTLTQPVPVDEDKVKPGEKVTLNFERIALVDLVISNNSNLIVKNKNGSITKTTVGSSITFAVTKNPVDNKGVTSKLKLTSKATVPPDALLGKAYIEGAIVYTVHNVNRTYIWTSEEFEIVAPN